MPSTDPSVNLSLCKEHLTTKSTKKQETIEKVSQKHGYRCNELFLATARKKNLFGKVNIDNGN